MACSAGPAVHTGMQQSMHCSLLNALLLQQQVTAILYANPDWAPLHGGELRLWLPPDASDIRSSEGASMANNAALDQPNTESPAPHNHAVPDRLNNATTLASAFDDRDGLSNASVPAAAPDEHAATNRHDSKSARVPAHDGHAATDAHHSGSVLAAACGDHAAPRR